MTTTDLAIFFVELALALVVVVALVRWVDRWPAARVENTLRRMRLRD